MLKKGVSKKRIVFTYEFAANYILHIFAVAKISYDSEYAERYSLTVQPQDLEYLKNHRYLLEFGNGRVSSFTHFCFFLPAYLGLRTKDDFMDYYSLIIDGLEKKDFSRFLRRYPMDWEDPFLVALYKELVSMSENVRSSMPEFKKIAQIFINNIEGYEPVWKQVEQVLKKRAEKLNYIFDKSSIIQEWEQVTGKTFMKEKYYIILCYANKNGPNANSLSYDRNVFYYGSSDEYIRDFVSHEVGTHLLSDLLLQEFDPVRYAAFECLAMFYNLKVLKSERLSYTLSRFQSDKFLTLYGKHYFGEITPEQLMELALEEIKSDDSFA